MRSVSDTSSTTEPPAEPTPSPAEAQAMRAMMAFLSSRFHTLQLFLLAGYGIMFLLCLALIGYLRLNRSSALRGDASAARKVILPAFEPLLWTLAAATGVYTGFFCAALATELYTTEISKLATEAFYSGRQFVFLSVVVFMLQSSVSGPALRRSLLLTLVLATYTLPVAWFMAAYRPKTEFYAVITAVRAPMLLLYTYILVRPPLRASRRTLREFCLFAYVYYALLFAYNDLFHRDQLETGFVLTYANLLCGSLCPLVIWRVLKADTQHWRGLSQRAVELQRLFQQTHRLPERVSSKGLHVLIEMHRKFIIDFAFLELKARIGTGASAVVFSGMLRSSTPAAIKVYTPMEITDETIAGFSQETALCGALHHPNIVRFYGMCICPPTVCLVSELCQGSFEDVMGAMARRNRTHELADNRRQLLLNVAYMLDAARAIAYMHSFRPAFLHRDIKPANFLVDREGTVKLTDFGESRPLPREHVAVNINGDSHALDSQTREVRSLSDAKGSMDIQVVVADMGPTMTVKGTVDYMAPEVINGRAGVAAYGEAADVFSLGMTMWDVLHPGQDKYPSANGNHFRVFDMVTSGLRPVLAPSIHPSLRTLMERAWQEDPRLRPSAEDVVAVLEGVQEEVCGSLAVDLMADLESGAVESKQITDPHGSGREHSFSGELAVEHMQRVNYVRSTCEALRVGNALMDAGLLHHHAHSQPFESSSAVYFFDDEGVNLCQPLPAKSVGALSASSIEDGTASSSSPRRLRPRSIGTSSRRSSGKKAKASRRPQPLQASSEGLESTALLMERSLCVCRRLGQRMEMPRASTRRRLRGKKKPATALALSPDREHQLQTRLLLASYDHRGRGDREPSDLDDFELLAASGVEEEA